MSANQLGRAKVIKYGVLAGVAGGGAEVIWIMAVGIMANISAVKVAYGVVTTAGLEIPSSTLGVLAGVAIHMAVAIALGIAVVAGCYALMGPSLQGIRLFFGLAAAEVLRRSVRNNTG